MATPLARSTPVLVHTEKAAAASTATTGVKLSYVAPAARNCKVTGANVANFVGGAPTVALQAILGGVTVELARGTAALASSGQIWLQIGDTIQWNCITAVAATTVDLSISVEDWEVQ